MADVDVSLEQQIFDLPRRQRMYIITAKRITSGELLKQRNGFFIERTYGSPLRASTRFSLTMPPATFERRKNGGSEEPPFSARL